MKKHIKVRDFLIERTSDALVLSGLFMLLMGIYYFGVKGGIPYQDPTPEMQIRYAVILGTGSELMENGILTGLVGIALKTCLWLRERKQL